MNNKNSWFSYLILTIFTMTITNTLYAGTNSSKDKTSKYLLGLESSLKICRTTYIAEILGIEADAKSYALNKEYEKGISDSFLHRSWMREGYKKIIQEKQTTGYDYKKCIDSTKDTNQSKMKSFIKDQSPKTRSIAKKVLSSWITAMDAISEKYYNEKLGDFNEKLNDFKLEQMLN